MGTRSDCPGGSGACQLAGAPPSSAPSSIEGEGSARAGDARFPPARERWGGGVNPRPIWPCLASFTPNRAMEMRPVWPRSGPPLTRTRWASRPWLWPWLASSGVPRSGETFNSVPFRSISFHSLSSARAEDARFLPSRERRGVLLGFRSFLSLISPLSRAVVQECAGVGTPHTLARYGPIWPDSLVGACAPSWGCEVPAFVGTTSCLRRNDVCNQCTDWRGDGAMGSCR